LFREKHVAFSEQVNRVHSGPEAKGVGKGGVGVNPPP